MPTHAEATWRWFRGVLLTAASQGSLEDLRPQFRDGDQIEEDHDGAEDQPERHGAVAAALLQLWRPNVIVFGIGLISAAFGLVLYNTRLSALAVALLLLSFARARP